MPAEVKKHKIITYQEFLGLRTSVSHPDENSAKDVSNFTRTKIVGQLISTPGYALKFDDGGDTDLPQTTDNAQPNYLDPAVHFIFNLVWENIENFFVPQHGGRRVTAALGTYEKRGADPFAPYTERSGLWIRPWWDTDQQKWSDEVGFVGDAWLELTEMVTERLHTIDATDKTRYHLENVYATNKFRNWVAVFGDLNRFAQGNDHDNYLFVTESDDDYIDIWGDNTVIQRVIGNYVFLYRNWFNMELPSALSSQIYKLFNELRITTGNTQLDLAIMAGFRSKTFGWTNNKTIDRFISEQSMFDIWRYAWGLETPTVSAEANDPVPAGTYEFGETLVTDDGQETALRQLFQTTNELKSDAWTSVHANIILSDGTYIYEIDNDGVTAILRKLSIVDLHEVDSVKLSDLMVSTSRADYYVQGACLDGTTIYITSATFSGVQHTNVMSIKTDDLTLIAQKDASGDHDIPQACVVSGANLYVVKSTMFPSTNGILEKRDKVTLNSVATLVLTATSTKLRDITSDGTNLYICTGDSPAKLIQVVIATFLQSGASPLILSDNDAYSMVIVGAKLFVTLLTAPAKVVRVSIPANTEDGAPSPYVAAAGNDYATAIVYDGTYLFVVLDDGYPTLPNPNKPLKIVNRLDPVTMVEVGIFTFTNGSSDGHAGTPAGNTFILKLLNIGNYLYLNSTLLDKVNKLPTVSLTVIAGLKITIQALVSPSTVTNRFSKMRLYVQELVAGVGQGFNMLKEILFTADGGVGWEGTPVFNSISRHYYNRTTPIDLLGTDFANAGPELTTNIGRAANDTGVVKYLHGAFVPSRTYLCGVTKDGIDYRNRTFTCAFHGDGTIQYDVFPNNTLRVIDLEYGDGDTPKCVGAIETVAVVIKNRSIFLVLFDSVQGFIPKLVTNGYGIASFRTLVSMDDYLLWLDYNGVVKVTTRGIEIMNYAWLQELRDMSSAVKEAAIGIIDRTNRVYRLFINGRQRVMSLDDGEWMIEDYVLMPERVASDVDSEGTLNMLNGFKILTIGKGDGLQGGAGFSVLYQTVEQKHDSTPDEDYDFNLKRVSLRYQSDVDLILRIFKNGTNTEIGNSPFTLPKDKTRVRVQPFEARCSSFRLQISGAITEDNQSVVIQQMGYKAELIEAGGDELAE